MAHSVEIRTQAIKAYESGKLTQKEIVEYFGVSTSSLGRWLKRYRNNESIAPILDRGGRPSRVDEKGLSVIKKWVEKKPSITLDELCDKYEKKYHSPIGDSIISRAVIKLGLRYKKLSARAIESESSEVKKKEKNT